MLKRVGLKDVFWWFNGLDHLQAGNLLFGMSLNFQKLSNGFFLGLVVGCCCCLVFYGPIGLESICDIICNYKLLKP